MLDVLTATKTTSPSPSIFVDFEGVRLGQRTGSVCLMQIENTTTNHRFLVDVHLHQNVAFTTPGTNGTTLEDVLESKEILKGIWDGRNDSAGIFRGFGITMAGLKDLQLLSLHVFESAYRPKVAGALLKFCKLPRKEAKILLKTKNAGKKLFAPERGGITKSSSTVRSRSLWPRTHSPTSCSCLRCTTSSLLDCRMR